MTDLLDRLRDQACNREPFTKDHAHCICRLTNAAADEIERLQSRDRDVVGLLRAQLRVLGHIPCVVEDDATGSAELAMRMKQRRAQMGN